MPHELLPPPGLDHPLPKNLTAAQRVAIYVDLLETTEQMLIAGLKARMPPGSDIREAVRRVYERQSAEHVASLERIAERIHRVESQRACDSGSANA